MAQHSGMRRFCEMTQRGAVPLGELRRQSCPGTADERRSIIAMIRRSDSGRVAKEISQAVRRRVGTIKQEASGFYQLDVPVDRDTGNSPDMPYELGRDRAIYDLWNATDGIDQSARRKYGVELEKIFRWGDALGL